MDSKDLIGLVAALAWPVVACGGLTYIWRSDAIGKLIKISDSVKDLNGKLAELVDAEQKLRQTSLSLLDVTATINQVQEDFLSIKADVENIRDRVEQRQESPAFIEHNLVDDVKLREMFASIERSWQSLVQSLQQRFGQFDARSVAASARTFAHGNRKGPRLSYEQAEEIARLHSSIKSYRRRQASLQDWLDVPTRDAFVEACQQMEQQTRQV